MPKTMTAILTCAALGLPLAAAAGGLKLPPEATYLVGGNNRALSATPPEGYEGQWWTHPAGCRYSRAGRPGEIVWFLNAVPRGASCPEFIMQKKIDDSYRAPHMYHG